MHPSRSTVHETDVQRITDFLASLGDSPDAVAATLTRMGMASEYPVFEALGTLTLSPDVRHLHDGPELEDTLEILWHDGTVQVVPMPDAVVSFSDHVQRGAYPALAAPAIPFRPWSRPVPADASTRRLADAALLNASQRVLVGCGVCEDALLRLAQTYQEVLAGYTPLSRLQGAAHRLVLHCVEVEGASPA